MIFIKKFFNNISFSRYNYIFSYAIKVKLYCDEIVMNLHDVRHDIGIFEQFFFRSYIR